MRCPDQMESETLTDQHRIVTVHPQPPAPLRPHFPTGI
jgi:hypothetical protein